MFIPLSLVCQPLSQLKDISVNGIHYAYGYGELGMMIERYRLDHDPKDLDDCPPELCNERRRSLEDVHAEIIPKGEPKTISRKKVSRADPPTPLVDAAPAAVAPAIDLTDTDPPTAPSRLVYAVPAVVSPAIDLTQLPEVRVSIQIKERGPIPLYLTGHKYFHGNQKGQGEQGGRRRR